MTIDTKSFRGSYLLYRKAGGGMARVTGDKGGGAPRFRHSDHASAVAEAARLLERYPMSTFLILQEVGRVKALPPTVEKPANPDAATGCADDRTFAAVPADTLRRLADG